MLIQLHPRPVSVAHVKSTSDISSPCIKVCIIESDYCIGCGRTLDEIGEWLKASDQRKKEIKDQCGKRIQNRL